ncbi:MAG: hypothetical protein AAFY20_00890 [Cyanobacteria bacterium J06639_14]
MAICDDRVCAGMDITGAVGLTAGQRTALKLMGAVDRGVDGWKGGRVEEWKGGRAIAVEHLGKTGACKLVSLYGYSLANV